MLELRQAAASGTQNPVRVVFEVASQQRRVPTRHLRDSDREVLRATPKTATTNIVGAEQAFVYKVQQELMPILPLDTSVPCMEALPSISLSGVVEAVLHDILHMTTLGVWVAVEQGEARF
jgi:hypothetical protein